MEIEYEMLVADWVEVQKDTEGCPSHAGFSTSQDARL
jgi:hypothetical protein